MDAKGDAPLREMVWLVRDTGKLERSKVRLPLVLPPLLDDVPEEAKEREPAVGRDCLRTARGWTGIRFWDEAVWIDRCAAAAFDDALGRRMCVA